MLESNSKNVNTRTSHRLHLAVLAALPMLMAANIHAATTTSGVTVDGQIYTGGESTMTNASGTTVGITNATATGASAWLEGVGNTVNNDGTITRSSSSGHTYGLFMGDYTLARNNSANKAVTGTGLTGTTTMQITTSAVLTPDQLIGKQILMAGTIVDGEARPGDLRTIATATLVTGTTYNITVAGDGWTKDQAGNQFNIIAGSGLNVVNNSGKISANYTGTAVTNVRAVETNIAGDYIINNSGTISASHTSIGSPQGIDAGGDVTNMTVNNSGTIMTTRNETITLTTNTAISLQASSSSIAAASLGSAAAIYSQEELASITVNNSADGKIIGVGQFAPAIYLRAAEQVIVNDGEISGSRIATAAGTYYGMAIGSVSDSGEVRTLDMTNNGTVNGDILAVNGNAYRWYALSNFNATGGANPTQAEFDSRLNISSSWGQLDSIISNAGSINGSLYYSNGTHELVNEQGATITGNIDVDQRDTTFTASGITNTVVGTKAYTFENAGTFDGNLTIRTASSSALGGTTPVASNVTLIPTITGSGAGSTLDAPSANIAGMANILTIDATAGAGTVTVAPKSLVTVHTGEYFKVANTLTLAGGAVIPAVDSANTPLVNWNIATNTGGNLVIGVDSVNSAATIAGVSATSAAAIDALMTSNTAIGGAVQGLTLAADIEKAGQQLRPEANNASMQASMVAVNQITSLIGKHQDEVRVASNGGSGVSTGEAAQGRGFWMQGFGFKGDQNKRGGIDGYTADTGGFAFGGDTLMGNGDFLMGAAFGYASTGVNGDGANAANRTDIDSYQATLYGSWNAGAWYVDAALGYGRHQYDTKRSVVVGAVSDTVTGSHDANQYLAKIGGGYPVQLGKITVTPLASLTYVHLDQDGYTEISTAGAALVLNGTQTDSLRSGVGAKMSVPLSQGSVKTALEVRAIWNHEFSDTNQDITARFAAGGASFTTNGVSQARDSANLGLGVNMSSNNGQTLSANYDAEVKSDYVGHTASVKFRYDF